jgi:hypothetical protein
MYHKDIFKGQNPKVFFIVEKQTQVVQPLNQHKSYLGPRIKPLVLVSPH